MINNLFSVFDPSIAPLSLSWASLFLFTSFIQVTFWRFSTAYVIIINKVIATFSNEVSFTLGQEENGSNEIVILAFVLVLTLNFLALYPQVFSPTSHLAVTLPLSLTFWLSLALFGWINNTNNMLIHLLPQGTPIPLISFIVAIELTSTIIRPITLCVRLTANLIAGHLLLSLLGNALINVSPAISIASLTAPIVLTVLEVAVACIQAYVFITLVSLYLNEAK